MIKQLIDSHFSSHYHLARIVTIDESHTKDSRFDLQGENRAMILEYGKGFASFYNETQTDIAVRKRETEQGGNGNGHGDERREGVEEVLIRLRYDRGQDREDHADD